MAPKTSRKKVVVERRDGERANRVLTVRHRLVKRGSRKQESAWSRSTTKNMSVSGLMFLSPVLYRPGDVIELEIVLSGMIDIYSGLAKVVRVQEAASRSFDVAARYIEVQFKHRPAKSHLKL